MIEGILFLLSLVFLLFHLTKRVIPLAVFHFSFGIVLLDFEYSWIYSIKAMIVFTTLYIYTWLKMEKDYHFESLILLFWTSIGSLCAVESTTSLALFLSLEIQSLGICILTALKKKHTDATETAIKYFFNTGLSSGFFLFGLSVIFAQTGQLEFLEESPIGLLLVLISFALKLSAAPFHWWSPDIYQGASIAMTTFISIMPKLSLFPTLIRLSYHFAPSHLIILSLTSFVVGSLGGLSQFNVKRLLAYSSIHFMGFIILGFATKTSEGFTGCFYSLIVYVLNILTFFSILIHIKRRIRTFRMFDDLDGLGKFSPFLSVCLSIIVLSFAGLPFFPGFLGKFFILKAAIHQQLYIPCFFAIFTSLISMVYYIRFLKHMFLNDFHLPLQPLATLEMTKFLVVFGIGTSYLVYFFPNFLPKIHSTFYFLK